MKAGKYIYFLKPRFLNVFLTFFVLCLPILREQYYTGEYVTWHIPIVVIFNNLQNLRQPEFLLIMALFILIIYFLKSLVLVGLSKFIFPILKR